MDKRNIELIIAPCPSYMDSNSETYIRFKAFDEATGGMNVLVGEFTELDDLTQSIGDYASDNALFVEDLIIRAWWLK